MFCRIVLCTWSSGPLRVPMAFLITPTRAATVGCNIPRPGLLSVEVLPSELVRLRLPGVTRNHQVWQHSQTGLPEGLWNLHASQSTSVPVGLRMSQSDNKWKNNVPRYGDHLNCCGNYRRLSHPTLEAPVNAAKSTKVPNPRCLNPHSTPKPYSQELHGPGLQ